MSVGVGRVTRRKKMRETGSRIKHPRAGLQIDTSLHNSASYSASDSPANYLSVSVSRKIIESDTNSTYSVVKHIPCRRCVDSVRIHAGLQEVNSSSSTNQAVAARMIAAKPPQPHGRCSRATVRDTARPAGARGNRGADAPPLARSVDVLHDPGTRVMRGVAHLTAGHQESPEQPQARCHVPRRRGGQPHER